MFFPYLNIKEAFIFFSGGLLKIFEAFASSVVKATDILILSWFCSRFNLVENSDVLEDLLSV